MTYITIQTYLVCFSKNTVIICSNHRVVLDAYLHDPRRQWVWQVHTPHTCCRWICLSLTSNPMVFVPAHKKIGFWSKFGSTPTSRYRFCLRQLSQMCWLLEGEITPNCIHTKELTPLKFTPRGTIHEQVSNLWISLLSVISPHMFCHSSPVSGQQGKKKKNSRL